jgi:hypothetical protein
MALKSHPWFKTGLWGSIIGYLLRYACPAVYSRIDRFGCGRRLFGLCTSPPPCSFSDPCSLQMVKESRKGAVEERSYYSIYMHSDLIAKAAADWDRL